MLNIKRVVVSTAIILSTSHVALGNETGKMIFTQGNGKGATACSTCHGIQGNGSGTAGFPCLSNQSSVYLRKQLEDFRNNKRLNPMMSPIAKALTKAEILAVTNYVTNIGAGKSITASPKVDSALLKAGEHLAKIGNWAQNIPPCFACHGPEGYGVGNHFPTLAGQHASYITNQIRSWQSGTRNNDPNNLMKVVAQRLSDKETKAISAYLNSLPPVKK